MRDAHALAIARAAMGAPIQELIIHEGGFESEAEQVYYELVKALAQCHTLKKLEVSGSSPAVALQVMP